MENLEIEVQKLPADSAMILMNGHLNSLTISQMETAVKGLLDEGITRVIFDLTKLTYASSAGVGAFVKVLHAIKTNDYKGVVIFIQPQPKVSELFNLFGVTDHMNIVPDRITALNMVTKISKGESVEGLKGI